MEQQKQISESQLEFIEWKINKLLSSVRDAQIEMGFKPLTQEQEEDTD